MEGVEILSTTSIYNTFLPGWIGAIGFFSMFVFLVLGIICICSDRYGLLVLCGVLTVAMFAVAICGDIDNKNSVHHMEHKVTINDSVAFNDFLEYYEILDQEGKIYTVKERE